MLHAASCLACWNGAFAKQRGQTYCDIAQPGYFTNITPAPNNGTYDNVTTLLFDGTNFKAGASDPVPCGLGYFQNVSMQTTCNPCDPGTNAPVTALTQCRPCGSGRWVSPAG